MVKIISFFIFYIFKYVSLCEDRKRDKEFVFLSNTVIHAIQDHPEALYERQKLLKKSFMTTRMFLNCPFCCWKRMETGITRSTRRVY